MSLNKKYNVVVVIGYGWSGSGAVKDLLSEIASFQVLSSEFRLINDPGGLIDLENALIYGRSNTLINETIQRFYNLIEVLGRKFHWRGLNVRRFFSKFGWNYNELMNEQFENLSLKYIDDLIDLEYPGRLITDFYKMSYLDFFLFKVKYVISKAFGRKRNSPKRLFLSYPSKDEFIKKTQKYLNNICNIIAKTDDVTTIVLDQAIQPMALERGMEYFNSPKAIIVDRDPRDIFIEAKKLTHYSSIPTNDVNKFISWFKLTRNHPDYTFRDDVLRIQFEDLILNYNEVIKNIFLFLKVDPSVHVLKNKYLIPSISKKNIGLWKEYPIKQEINKIESELLKFCYKIQN